MGLQNGCQESCRHTHCNIALLWETAVWAMSSVPKHQRMKVSSRRWIRRKRVFWVHGQRPIRFITNYPQLTYILFCTGSQPPLLIFLIFILCVLSAPCSTAGRPQPAQSSTQLRTHRPPHHRQHLHRVLRAGCSFGWPRGFGSWWWWGSPALLRSLLLLLSKSRAKWAAARQPPSSVL